MGDVRRGILRAIKRFTTVGIVVGIGAGSLATCPVAANPGTSIQERTRTLNLPRVFIVGDSLTVSSKQQLRNRLRGRVLSLGIDARVGRHTPEGITRLRSRTAKRASVWVVALGTNDAASARQTRKNVAKVLRLAGPSRQVIWINVVRPGPYHRVNQAFRSLDSTHQNLAVIDWAAIVRGRSGLLASDRVHLTSRGNRIRTLVTCDAIAAAANQQRIARVQSV